MDQNTFYSKIENEFDLRKAELALKERELEARLEKERKSHWLASPVLLGVVSAIFGILGTGVGAALQGYWNTQLERQKFESGLIDRAMESGDSNRAAKLLLFLVDADLIKGLNAGKIRQYADDPESLPLYFHRGIQEGLITTREAKSILQQAGFYAGELDEALDQNFSNAVKQFQKNQGLVADGELGPETAEALLEIARIRGY